MISIFAEPLTRVYLLVMTHLFHNNVLNLAVNMDHVSSIIAVLIRLPDLLSLNVNHGKTQRVKFHLQFRLNIMTMSHGVSGWEWESNLWMMFRNLIDHYSILMMLEKVLYSQF